MIFLLDLDETFMKLVEHGMSNVSFSWIEHGVKVSYEQYFLLYAHGSKKKTVPQILENIFNPKIAPI